MDYPLRNINELSRIKKIFFQKRNSSIILARFRIQNFHKSMSIVLRITGVNYE